MQDFLRAKERAPLGRGRLGRKYCLIIVGARSDWQEAHAKPPAGFFMSVMTVAWQPEEKFEKPVYARIIFHNFERKGTADEEKK